MQSAPTMDEFLAQYPAFGVMDPGAVQAQLDLSSALLDSGAWGDFYGNAVGLEAAHNLTLDALIGTGPNGALQNAAGPVTSSSAGGMSASFAQLSVNEKSWSEKWYSKTAYGQRFLRLRGAVIGLGTMTC